MIFQATWQAVLDGRKTQTRRIKFPYVLWHQLRKYGWSVTREDWQANQITPAQIDEANNLLRTHHITVAVQPGRGQKAVGRIRLLDIRQEHVQDITEAGAITEGSTLSEYPGLWNSLHPHKSEQWSANPLCWVLVFSLV